MTVSLGSSQFKRFVGKLRSKGTVFKKKRQEITELSTGPAADRGDPKTEA